MSSEFQIVYKLRLEGAEAATANFNAVSESFRQGTSSIDQVETSMRKADRANAAFANSLTRAANAFMAAHPAFSMFEQTLGRITSVARTAVSLFDSWNILQIRLSGSANGVADAQDAVNTTTRTWLDAVAQFGPNSVQAITAANATTAAQKDLADKTKAASDALFQAQVNMGLLGLVALGQIPNIVKAGEGIAAWVETLPLVGSAAAVGTIGIVALGVGVAGAAGYLAAAVAHGDNLNDAVKRLLGSIKTGNPIIDAFSSFIVFAAAGFVMFGKAALDGVIMLGKFVGEGMKAVLDTVIGAGKLIGDAGQAIWDAITGAAGTAFKWLKEGWDALWNGLGSVVSSVSNAIVYAVKEGINGVIWILNRFVELANGIIAGINTVSGVFGVHIPNIPTIPYLAQGGIVTSPTLAMIGEAGPEAVVPLSGGQRGGIGGATTVNQYFNFPNYFGSKDDLVRMLKTALKEEGGRRYS